MMATPYDDGHDRMGEDSASRFGYSLFNEPMTRQPMTVPGEHRSEIRHDFGLTRRRHQAFIDLAEVACELIEPVSVVAEQICFDEDVGNRSCAIASQPRPFEQGGREHG